IGSPSLVSSPRTAPTVAAPGRISTAALVASQPVVTDVTGNVCMNCGTVATTLASVSAHEPTTFAVTDSVPSTTEKPSAVIAPWKRASPSGSTQVPNALAPRMYFGA